MLCVVNKNKGVMGMILVVRGRVVEGGWHLKM